MTAVEIASHSPHTDSEIGRLMAAISSTFDQIQALQRRYRVALDSADGDAATDLVDAWHDFHRMLTLVRYAPQMTALEHGAPTDADLDVALLLGAELTQAYQRLEHEMTTVPPRRGSAGGNDQAALLARWRLACRGNKQVRWACSYALANLDRAGTGQPQQIAHLFAEALAAEPLVDDVYRDASGTPARSRLRRLEQCVADATELRELLELAVLGASPHGMIGRGADAPEITTAAPEPRPKADPTPPSRPTPPAVPAPPPPQTPRTTAALADAKALVTAYRDLVGRCRYALAGLNGPQRSVHQQREHLLALWGRYDNRMTAVTHLMALAGGHDQIAARRLAIEVDEVHALADELAAVAATGAADLTRFAQPGQDNEVDAWPAESLGTPGWARAHRPRLGPVEDDAGVPGPEWLPRGLRVNADPVELFVASATPPKVAVLDGVRSGHLFVVGRLDPCRAADELGRGYLLRVRAEPGAAVDLVASNVRVPEHAAGMFAPNDAFLLPAGWLGRVWVQSGYGIAAGGVLHSFGRLPEAPLTIRAGGASHGVDGLVNEVERWPRKRIGAGTTTAYAIIPPVGGEPVGDGVALRVQIPAVRRDYRLVELRVAAGAGIDVTRSALALKPFPSVRTALGGMLSDDITLILPRGSFASTPVARVFEAAKTGWKPQRTARAVCLSDLI
jgi:hypothetical protein